jgi:hypothetical protein
MGFYELVRDAARSCTNSARVTLNIWTVFNKLLETCCKADHKLLMIELTKGLTEEMETVKEEAAARVHDFNAKEAVMRNRMKALENTIHE